MVVIIQNSKERGALVVETQIALARNVGHELQKRVQQRIPAGKI